LVSNNEQLEDKKSKQVVSLQRQKNGFYSDEILNVNSDQWRNEKSELFRGGTSFVINQAAENEPLDRKVVEPLIDQEVKKLAAFDVNDDNSDLFDLSCFGITDIDKDPVLFSDLYADSVVISDYESSAESSPVIRKRSRTNSNSTDRPRTRSFNYGY
jgi:hypothetical protein